MSCNEVWHPWFEGDLQDTHKKRKKCYSFPSAPSRERTAVALVGLATSRDYRPVRSPLPLSPSLPAQLPPLAY